LIAQADEVKDDAIEMFIFESLVGQPITVDSETDMKNHLKMQGVSNARMMRRLGAMIKRGVVLRCRRHMEHRDDYDRPITYMIKP
jgi:hypothetical protein